MTYLDDPFNMKSHGYKTVIHLLSSDRAHQCNTKEIHHYFINIQARITILTFLGFMFFVYPLLGHLADVYLTRYHTLKSAYMIIIIGGSALLAYVTIGLTADLVWNFKLLHHKQTSAIPLLLFAVYMVGLGLFQANTIQFGLDQLLEAPTPKLISFIHWYYWSQNVAGLVLFYTGSACMATYHETGDTKKIITLTIIYKK